MRQMITFLLLGLFSQMAFSLQVDKGKVILEKLEDYELCQRHDYSGDWCHEAMKDWVKAHPSDAFKAGKMTRLKMNSAAAVPFFEKAFEQKQGDCKDKDVQLAVVGGLNLSKTSNADLVTASKKIAIDLCYKEMKDALLKEASVGSYLFENVCKDLSDKGELQGLKAKKCQEVTK